MITIMIIDDKGEWEDEYSAEIPDEDFSIFNLFKGFENCLLEAGVTEAEISEYYIINSTSIN